MTQTTKARLARFVSYYKPHTRIFAMDLFFAALSATSVLLFPLVSGYITREVLSVWTDKSLATLITAGLLLLVLTIIKTASNIIYAYFGHAMGAKMESTMRCELLAHYQDQSFSFHAQNSVGRLMTVLSNDLTGMTELFHHGPEDILMTIIKFGGAFAIMMSIQPVLSIIVFSVLPVLTYAAIKADRVMNRALRKSKENLSAMNECLEDTLSGIRTIKAYGNERQQNLRFSIIDRAYTKSKCSFYRVEALFYETVESYPQVLTMLVVFFGALFLGNGTVDVVMLVTFLLYVGTIAEPVRTLLNFMRLYEEGRVGFTRFMEMMETKPTVEEAIPCVTLSNPKGDIAFQGVRFHYDDADTNVLEDITFAIQAGQCVAFAGASGIGKTTIASLLARFYDVSDGQITLDGHDIRQISIASLRNMVGIVQQEVYVFNGTIRENIRFGKMDATDSEIENAAKRANIHNFIQSLPHGYDSFVGTKGIMLSGGQRQRLSIARLFLKNPPILILDEATSALDYESEQVVQDSLNLLMQDRTTIIIAHRLSTIQHADVIFVLADRKLVEQGTHAELIAQGSEYARLCARGSL